MTDFEIVEGLIERDDTITRNFFFVNCRPLFYAIIRKVFSYRVDYDEMVNELYLYLMENDAYRLRQFNGRSSIYQWLKTVAIRYFIQKRKRMIDGAPVRPLYEKEKGEDSQRSMDFEIDLRMLIGRVRNLTYQRVLGMIYFEDFDAEVAANLLGVTKANFYNIKHRAMQSLLHEASSEYYG